MLERTFKNNNDAADFYYYEWGVNTIPFDTKLRRPVLRSFKEHLDNPIPEFLFIDWKEEGKFDKGFNIVCGNAPHGKYSRYYLIGIDIDKERGIEEFCKRNGKETTLQELGNVTVVEQHKDDLTRAHIYYFSPFPFPSKSADSILGIEIKGEHMMITPTPNIHHKNGCPHQIIGNKKIPVILTHDQSIELLRHIDYLCLQYDLKYLEKSNSNKITPKIRAMIKSLSINNDITLNQGERHLGLLSIADSLLIIHYHSKKERKIKIDKLQGFLSKINVELCKPEPLPQNEVDNIWKSALEFTERNKEKYKQGKKYYDDDNNEQTELKEGHQSAAEFLIKLIQNNTNNFQLFKDQYNIAYAIVNIKDHFEILSIEGTRYKRYLSKLYYDICDGKIANAETINSVVQILQATAEFEGKTIPLHLRVAWSENKDAIYYDLTDEKRRCIKITKGDGWIIVENQLTVLFTRHPHHLPQVEPTHFYHEKIFDEFINSINIKNEKYKLLIKVYIITLLIPDISHPILLPHGEKGSAKSTLQKKIKLIIDPSILNILTINNDKTEFIQQLSHNWLAFYDNVRYEPRWLSDESCKASTGIASSKRKLYTDDEDKIYNYKRCLSFSGIIVIFTEPDILDRSIKIELERIDDKVNIPEEKILANLKQQLPQLLGYIFDTLSKAIQVKDSLSLDRLPRMADFALWGEAIARVIGYKPLEFLDAYYQNIGESNIEVIESDGFADTLIKLFNSYNSEICWISSPKIFINKIKEYAEKNDIDTSKFPKSTNSLTRRLRKIKSNLRDGLGIEVTIERITSGKGNKNLFNTTLVKIRKTSPVSPTSPIDKYYEEKITKDIGDINTTISSIANESKISPIKNEQLRGQITRDTEKTGDTGDTGDDLGIVWGRPKSSVKYFNETLQVKIEKYLQSGKTLKCHQENCNTKEYTSLKDYNAHCHSKHPKQPMYPDLSLIESMKLNSHGNPWENGDDK